jgi:DNA ligase (NAD+)
MIASGCIPKTIPKDLAPVEVRGEVYIPLAAFKTHLAERFSNPRNTAAGAIKQKDHEATPGYHLKFFAYDLIVEDHPDEELKFERLNRMGFEPIDKSFCPTPEQLQEAIEHFSDQRDQLAYETDGVVARTLRASEQTRLGLTAHHPRFAVAFKFTGDVAETALMAVDWQVARTGTITPVALLEPVELSGAIVSRASLHHAGRIEALELALPARVLAARRGGVIPHVEAVIQQGTQPVELPTQCPGCAAPTRRNDDFLLCSQPSTCRPAQVARLIHWARAFDLEGLGQKLAELLYDEGLAQHPVDLYQLKRSALLQLPRMAEKSADNILQQIDKSRSGTGHQFLVGLGIDDLGVTVAERLLNELGDVQQLREASIERLLRIDGVGSIMAQGIHDTLQKRSEEIRNLLDVMDLQKPQNPEEPSGPLLGWWVVFTGTLETNDRKSAQHAARQLGAQTPSQCLSQNQGILVVGDRQSALLDEGRVSSKHSKARTLIRKEIDLMILQEKEWLQLLKGVTPLSHLHQVWGKKIR